MTPIGQQQRTAFETTTAAESWPRERVFMPQSRPPRRCPASAESGGLRTFAPDFRVRWVPWLPPPTVAGPR